MALRPAVRILHEPAGFNRQQKSCSFFAQERILSMSRTLRARERTGRSPDEVVESRIGRLVITSKDLTCPAIFVPR